ncbi:MAG: transglycosylase SLT domain-containing protein [Bacteroidia bacterium]
MNIRIDSLSKWRDFRLIQFVEVSNFKNELKTTSIVLFFVLTTNLVSHGIFNPLLFKKNENTKLYLMEKAAVYITENELFEKKIVEISKKLEIQPEWLMAVIYSESRFNPNAVNYKGSGAVGLIQFMPKTANEMNITTAKIGKMTAIEQLDYVYQYLLQVKEKYGKYNSLTDLYLAILYPKALEYKHDFCFTMYENPSIMYKQNLGLDENKDGNVTISDIDNRMKRIFPTAYIAGKNKSEFYFINKLK